jgi:hypothetical protein
MSPQDVQLRVTESRDDGNPGSRPWPAVTANSHAEKAVTLSIRAGPPHILYATAEHEHKQLIKLRYLS